MRDSPPWWHAARLGLAAALAAGVASPAPAQGVDPGTVIQTIQAWRWSPPSPDTSGITYRPDTGELLSCDGEVEEMELFAGVNVWRHTRTGVVTGTANTTSYSNEPTGIAWDPAGGRLWIADDNQRRIYEIRFGTDGVWNTADDVRRPLSNYDSAGCDDLEDVGYNPFTGQLYVSSGGSQEVCTISRGPNGQLDGAPPSGDDVVTLFSVAPFGISDPEGVVYDPFWNTLVLADRGTRDLYELTPQGAYLRKIDVNFPSGTRPSGITIAPGSTNPMLRNYWVSDRRVDNGGNPDENDGQIYEVVAIPLGGNGAPVVDAGPPQTVRWPQDTVTLSGFVNDDGHPFPPSLVASLWSKQSGPGSVAFGSASSPSTTATFSAPGSYVLRLEGDDSEEQRSDTVSILLDDTVSLATTVVGPGAVSRSPPGSSYSYGQTVSLTATPGPDATFVGWGGDLAGATNPQPLLMDGDKSVTASFAELHDLAVQTDGPGSVSLDPPGGRYPAGTQVTLTATPGPDAVFTGWSGALTGTTSPRTFVVPGDATVVASFVQHYTVSLSAIGPGSVALSPPAGPYAPGSTVTVTATPHADAAFVGFAGDLSGTASPQPLVMDANRSVTGSFATLYDVAVTTTGPGSVALSPPGGTYPAGTQLTVTATPDANAAFTGFGGSLSGTGSPQLLLVDGDQALSASFASLHTLSVTTQGAGSVALSPPGGSYVAGTRVSLIAAPGSNAVFAGWGGALTGDANPAELTLAGDTEVSASFVQLYAVEATALGPGSVALSPPTGPYPAGSLVTLTALPAEGAGFLGWSGALSGLSNPASLLVDGDELVIGTFASPAFALAVSQEGGGSVLLDPPGGVYAGGAIVTITAVPRPNWVFGGWSGDAAGTSNPLQVSMDADRAVHARFSSLGGGGSACGLGPELAPLVPALAAVRRRRRAP